MRRSLVVGLLALALLGFGAPPVAAAAPLTTVDCGFIVERSIRVANSIFGCTEHGLTVTGDDVVLDLNGNFVSGNDADNNGSVLEAGVNCVSCTGLVVKNGTVRDFEAGVAFGQTSTKNRASSIRAISNGTGIRLVGLDHTVTRSTATGNGTGITVQGAGHLVRTSNATSNSVGFDVVGTNATIEDNVAASNTGDGFTADPGAGHVFRENLARENGSDGFEVGGTGQRFVGNRADGNTAAGFRVDGSDHVLRANRATDSHFDGYVLSGDDIRSTGDIAQGNGRIGIASSGQRNLIDGARLNGNIEDGIQSFGTGTSIRNTVATGNGDDGIQSFATDAVVKGNTANRNGFLNGAADNEGLGIRASGVGLSAGRNQAADNDDADECTVAANCN